MAKKKTKEQLQDDLINKLPLVLALRDQINKRDNLISKLNKELGQQKQFQYDILQGIELVKPYLPIYKPSKKTKVGSPVSVVVQFGDWHIGEMVDRNEAGHYNEYNYQIAQDRVFNIVDGINKWVNLNRTSYKIDLGYVLDLGDNISGDIHQELTVTNEFTVPEQIIKAAYLKAEAYRRLACNFKKLKVIFVVPDNHSRKTKKPQAKQCGKNSENYLVGFLAKTMLADIKNIDFELHLPHQASIEISGRRYICEHGNTVKSYMGFPYYGIDRKVGREAKRMMRIEGFDKMILQHFHVPMNTQYFLIGGSLSGTTEFDHTQGRHAEPAQCAWMVHPKRGEFNWCTFRGDV